MTEMLVPADFGGIVDRPDWHLDALCKETDPEAFFPDKGGSTREAKRICQGCEVKDECLAYALEHQERFGIWGGFSERERRKLARGEPVGTGLSKRSIAKIDPEFDAAVARLTVPGRTHSSIAAELGAHQSRVSNAIRRNRKRGAA